MAAGAVNCHLRTLMITNQPTGRLTQKAGDSVDDFDECDDAIFLPGGGMGVGRRKNDSGGASETMGQSGGHVSPAD